VRSAVATLRRLGLREHLLTTGGGYALEGRVVLDDAPATILHEGPAFEP